MKLLFLLILIISFNSQGEMSPEESNASDYLMIEQSLELRKKLSASYFDEIEKIENSKGTFYTVLRDRCLAIVEVGRVDEKKPMPGSLKRVIKDIRGPICFRK